MARMEIKSAAGGFEMEIEKVTVDGDKIVLVGALDGLDCRTVVDSGEVLSLMRLGCRRDVAMCLIKRLTARPLRKSEPR